MNNLVFQFFAIVFIKMWGLYFIISLWEQCARCQIIYTQNAPQYEGDCEYRISSEFMFQKVLKFANYAEAVLVWEIMLFCSNYAKDYAAVLTLAIAERQSRKSRLISTVLRLQRRPDVATTSHQCSVSRIVVNTTVAPSSQSNRSGAGCIKVKRTPGLYVGRSLHVGRN